MINILTKPYDRISGPNKVISNLKSGLDKIHYPYVINGKLNYCENIFIPNSQKNLLKISAKLFGSKKLILGPNLYVLPIDIPFAFKPIIKKSSYYLQPSEWAKKLWVEFDFNLTKIEVWPVGIDTNKFSERTIPRQLSVMVYFKQRKLPLLNDICNILEKKNLKYILIKYGEYDENQFNLELSKTSFIIWYGSHESQGIALQECLSSNVPMIILDSKSLWNQQPNFGYENYKSKLNNFEVTSAPYFDKDCGIKLEDYNLLSQSIDYMLDNYSKFKPRDYILKNLSLEKQANELIRLFDED